LRVGPQRHNFFSQAVHLTDIACGISIVDPHVAAIDPAEFLQSLIERIDVRLHLWIVRRESNDYSDTSYPIRLLRAHMQWPCGGPSDKRDELSACH